MSVTVNREVALVVILEVVTFTPGVSVTLEVNISVEFIFPVVVGMMIVVEILEAAYCSVTLGPSVVVVILVAVIFTVAFIILKVV